MDQNSQNINLSNNSRTTWPTLILMLLVSSLDNLHIYYFRKGVDNFDVEHKTC